MNVKGLFRINYIRNHYLRFGFLKGLKIYLKLQIFKNNSTVNIQLPRYKHKILLRRNSSDIKVFYQIFFKEEYKINLESTPNIILDLGANIGLSAIYFAQKYPQAKIISVEPDKGNFDLCIQNTKFYKNRACINSAIWYNNESLKTIDNNIGVWAISVNPVDGDNNGNSGLKGITISQIFEKYGLNKIDLLKIDIEGAEKEVFEKRDISWLNYVDTIVMKLHDWMKEGRTKSFFKAVTKRYFAFSFTGENCLVKFKNQ